MPLMLYGLLLRIVAVPLVLMLSWRGQRQGDDSGRWAERFGVVPRAARPVAVWVHASSVGEVMAARPLLDALIARFGDGGVWVTTMTTTGSREVRRIWGDRVQHSYVPVDLPGSVRRFLRRARPSACIVLETEIWPNLYASLRRRRVPLMLANARLSPRSLRGYGRIRGSIRQVLGNVTLVAAQSEADAERFRQLGAPNVTSVGNIKFDLTPPPEQLSAGQAWRASFAHRPVWVAASTHDGEEASVLAAHRDLLRWHPTTLLLLVPRHPQRFASVERTLVRDGWRFCRRSQLSDDDAPSSECSLVLGDSMGEMFRYLAAADVAYVGGSLVEVGGHNVLEPAALGLPVLFGPHMFNFVHARALLMDAGCAREVASAQDLAVNVAALISQADERTRRGAAGSDAVAANRGAVDRLMAALADIQTTWPPVTSG